MSERKNRFILFSDSKQDSSFHNNRVEDDLKKDFFRKKPTVRKDEVGKAIFNTLYDMFSKKKKEGVLMKEEKPIVLDSNDVENTFQQSFQSPDPVLYYSDEDSEIEGFTDSRSREFQTNRNLQDMINKILQIDDLQPVQVQLDKQTSEERQKKEQMRVERVQEEERKARFQQEIYETITPENRPVIFKSDLLAKINANCEISKRFSILARYGEDYCNKDFPTNPAIGRENEIKQLILTLLTPEKSAILIGKPGIGKTSIVEGLAYRLQRGDVPEALQGFTIINIKTPSLIGTLPNGETRLQTLVDELKTLDHVILFIDEIHMLIGATNDSAMDFANMFKEGLGRGRIKVIGATTTEEYERYILRDKAFVRRFQSIEVLEPSREHTIKILMGTLPKIERDTGAKMKYTTFIQSEIMGFIVDITSEYKRIYGIGSRYPDICLTLLKEAFSQCIFDNRNRVTIFDVRHAILNSKNIYPDVIRKEIPIFDEKFRKIIYEEKNLENIDHL